MTYPQMPNTTIGAAPQLSFPVPSNQAPAPQVDLSGVNQKLDGLLALVGQQNTRIAALEREVKICSMVITVLGRGMFQKQGSQDPAAFLTELGLPLPQ